MASIKNKLFNRKLKSTKDSRIHEHTEFPQRAWEQIRVGVEKTQCEPLSLDTPVYEDKIRFVCISDTHSKLSKVTVPPGDVLLHAGDFTGEGRPTEVKKFNEALGKLPHKYKVVIAGNHELSFDKLTSRTVGVDKPREVKKLLTNCIYLEESSVEIMGVRIYGSPCQPVFMGWAFNIPRGRALMDVWDRIPSSTDILITHGPPVGFGDRIQTREHVGCVELLTTVRQRVRPKYHIFGHIHEDHGMWTDGTTVFINAATCTASYRPTQPPIIFDLPLPDGIISKKTVTMEINNKLNPDPEVDKETGNSMAEKLSNLSIGEGES